MTRVVPQNDRENGMNFYTRRLVRPEDLNANNTLFGGRLLEWIDEEAAIYAIIQLGSPRIVTKYISEISFESPARTGDLIELGFIATHFGNSSLTMRATVRHVISRTQILSIDRIVFVHVDENGRPAPHGYSTITYNRDRHPVAV